MAKNKKNRMSVSCEVEDETNFKAICDILANGKKASTINGTHSQTLVKFMKKYYKNAYKNLTQKQKSDFELIKSIYKENKSKNGII